MQTVNTPLVFQPPFWKYLLHNPSRTVHFISTQVFTSNWQSLTFYFDLSSRSFYFVQLLLESCWRWGRYERIVNNGLRAFQPEFQIKVPQYTVTHYILIATETTEQHGNCNCCRATVGSEQQHNQDLREIYKGRRILKFITFYHNALHLTTLFTTMHCI